MVDHHGVHGRGVVVVVRGDHGDPRHLVVTRSTARGAGGAGIPILRCCTGIVISVRLEENYLIVMQVEENGKKSDGILVLLFFF